MRTKPFISVMRTGKKWAFSPCAWASAPRCATSPMCLSSLAEEAARQLKALTITLKVELDNAPALNLYRKAGYEELSRRRGMATMRRDLEAA